MYGLDRINACVHMVPVAGALKLLTHNPAAWEGGELL